MPYDFSLDRKSTITLSAGSVLLLVLVFVAGVLTGLTWRTQEQEMMAAQKPAVAAVSMMRPVATAAASAPPPKPAPPAAAATPMPAAPMPAPAAPAAATAASAAPPDAQAPAAATASPGVQLAIQVGAFLDKSNADKLVERLKEAGYAPQIVLSGHPPRQWNFVRVGPYHDWGEATQIAAVISRDEDTQAVVRPMQ